MILIGLMQVIIGLIVAYLAKSIYLLIFARFLQGSGAVISVAYSWIGDSVEGNKKFSAMNILGIIIGLASTVYFILGPLLNRVFSINNMFLICALLILITWLFILFLLKEEKGDKNIIFTRVTIIKNILLALKDKQFILLNLNALIINYILMGVFFIIPQDLQKIPKMSGATKLLIPIGIFSVLYIKVCTSLNVKGRGTTAMKASFIIMIVGMLCLLKNNRLYIYIGTDLSLVGYLCLTIIIPCITWSCRTRFYGYDPYSSGNTSLV